MLVEARRDRRDFAQRRRRQFRQPLGIGIDQPSRARERLRGPLRAGREGTRALRKPLVDARQVLRGQFDQFAELAVGHGEALDEVRDALGEARTRAADRAERFGGTVGDRGDERGVLGAQMLRRLARRFLHGPLQLAATLGETLDQRPRRLVEDLRDLGGTRGEHGVQLARVDADRAGGLVGALTDVLADGIECVGDDVGARDQLSLGCGDLLVELLAHRLGTACEPVLGGRDVHADAVGDGFRAFRQLVVGAGDGVLDEACVRFQLDRRLARAPRDPLFCIGESVGDVGSVGADGRRALGDAGGEFAIGSLEDAAHVAGALLQRLGRLVYAGGDTLVGALEDASDFLRTLREGSCGLVDPSGDALVGGFEGTSDFLRAQFERPCGLVDAGGDPFVGILEDAPDLDGAAGQRLRGLADAGRDLLVRGFEDRSDLGGATRQAVRRQFDACGDLLVGVLEHATDLGGTRREAACENRYPLGKLLVGLVEAVDDAVGIGLEPIRAVGNARGQPAVDRVEQTSEFSGAGGQRLRRFVDPGAEALVGIVERPCDLHGATGQFAGGLGGIGDQLLRSLRGPGDELPVRFVEQTGDVAGPFEQHPRRLRGAIGDETVGIG